VDPKLLETFRQLGSPLSEQKRTQQPWLCRLLFLTVFPIATTYREKLAELREWCSLLSGPFKTILS